VQGQLGEKLVPDLVRAVAHKGMSGLLRLTRGKTIKAIFFEAGAPKFAISNLATEQLDQRLIRENMATLVQIEAALQRAGKAPRLAAALVEMGTLSESEMRRMVRGQVMDIIVSVFEWVQGDYAFDERIRAAHDFTLDITAADVILEGARLAAKNEQVAQQMAPADGVLVRARSSSARIDSGKLIPVESYVLSRIESPTAVSDVGSLSGIADEDAHRAVCALVAAGFLKLAGREEEEPEEVQENDEELDHLREDVARRLHFFATADFYDILGVTKKTGTAEIKASYYQLAKKYHPDRYRQAGQEDLRQKLEALFALITQAYETLSGPAQRAAYDERMKKPAAAFQTTPLRPIAMPMVEPKPAPRPAPKPVETAAPPVKEQPPKDEAKTEPSPPKPSAPLPPVEMHKPESSPSRTSGMTPAQMAEQYYNQGRALFERKEYHTAVHLLREAVKIDPSRPAYHYHLGLALIRNPRARREADQHLTKAAELEPYNAQIRVKLGVLYKEVGLPKKADSYFRAALQIDPENRAARREIASEKAKNKAAEVSIWKSDLGTIAKRLFKK
jgi:curved DNA-binding protein CbpA